MYFGERQSVLQFIFLIGLPLKAWIRKLPMKLGMVKKPKVSHMKTFGCTAYVKATGPGLNKLSDRSSKMMFIGYESGTKGYRFFDLSAKKLVISRDVIFDERQPCNLTSGVNSSEQAMTASLFIMRRLTEIRQQLWLWTIQ